MMRYGSDPRRAQLAGPISVLRPWNYRWGVQSVPQTLAILWGDALVRLLNPPAEEPKNRYMDRLARDTSPEQKLQALRQAVARLNRDFGRWQVPWGEYNRFQRLTAAWSASSATPHRAFRWRSRTRIWLARVDRERPPSRTKHRFGTYGNSFVAVVEFSHTASRARRHRRWRERPSPSPHFNDEARALRHRQSARRLFLSGAAQRPYRTHLSSGRVVQPFFARPRLSRVNRSHCCSLTVV